ncbi:MAG: N-6 DNA methylase [Patescibacteria group bacterium]|nr:N-6 DNA methylase [Patescibacteria group bacterium]
MTLSWNEVRARANQFSRDWTGTTSEAGEKQTFWNEFFDIFGISRRKVATFEESVKKYEGQHGSIDLLYPGKLIVEHKSAGKNLDDAYQQAIEYANGLPEKATPEFIVVSDFTHFRIYNLEKPQEERMHEFKLSDLPKNIRLFGFLLGYQTVEVKTEDPVNQKAVKAVAKLHDALKKSGYTGHQLEVLLTRLVYCFFADDTGIFDELDTFQLYIEKRTSTDGSNTGPILAQIFQVLNQPLENRQNNLEEELAKLPYIDGPLFEERLDLPAFDSDMRKTLLECSTFDWGKISPVIFGSMFQSVMNEQARHDLGAHYTSETNIFKVIEPLFLDELKTELETAGKNKPKLHAFLTKIRDLRFLDPACGCGNFLVVTYRELRRLELEALKRLNVVADTGQRQMSALQFGMLSQVNVDQMFGIEIEEFPARVAALALWLTDHQMNMELSAEFGENFVRLPLKTHPNIHNANALQIDWNDVIPKEQLNYILGNPPFVGSKIMTNEQRGEISNLFQGVHGAGVLDYVTGWYIKAAKYIQETNIEVAFVSTNSITQGEQVGILWKELMEKYAIHINFAHRTFKWTNEAPGRAAVFCTIIGFSLFNKPNKAIFEYEDIKGEPHKVAAKKINTYLIDAPIIFIESRKKPLCQIPEIGIGNKPIDDGNYLFSRIEMHAFLQDEPEAKQYFRPWLGSDEFINRHERWCLYLGNVEPEKLRKLPKILKRIEAVKAFRLQSKSKPTIKLAQTPTKFHVENIPNSNYLLIPRVSSERRLYIPIGFIDKHTLSSDSVHIMPSATLYHFGILTSTMHMAWVRQVCGRLKSDYRYSKDIVYNNFPWPENPAEAQTKAVEKAAQDVLDARKAHPGSTLADLYDPNTMPSGLVKAHQALDKAVDKCYGKKTFANEMERLELLFGMYKELTERQMELLETEKNDKKRERKK